MRDKTHMFDLTKVFSHVNTTMAWAPAACGSAVSIRPEVGQKQNDRARRDPGSITCMHCRKRALKLWSETMALNNENYRKGLRDAADIADHYNRSTTHKYMLGDCILAKLNRLQAIRGRKKPRKIK